MGHTEMDDAAGPSWGDVASIEDEVLVKTHGYECSWVAEKLPSLCDCQSWEAPIAPLTATEDPMKPWQTVSVDILGPFEDVRPTHRFLLVLTDVFSRWVDAEPASPCMSNSSKKLSIVSGIPLILSPTALLHRNPYPGDAIYSEVT